jgi:23S rRNA pseudouridine2605 synthase
MNTNKSGRSGSRGASSSKSSKFPFKKKSEAGGKKTFSSSAKTSPFAKNKPKTSEEDEQPKVKPAASTASPKDKGRFADFKGKQKKGDPMPKTNAIDIRLNKYLSNAGICSRREADVLIQTGVVSVNGKMILEMGYKVQPGDKVMYDGETINAEKKRYVILNKPKDFITTMDDPLGRKTVMSLVNKACRERIYPVGRLDRETTGLLLFTNDGDMAKKLTHPNYKCPKLYHVELDKPFKKEDLAKLTTGVMLDDGKSVFDKAEYVKESSREIGVELHSGKNRIVRRTMEALGYTVVKLDRVKFASLSKKDLPRGYYRHLTEKEVAFLKMS